VGNLDNFCESIVIVWRGLVTDCIYGGAFFFIVRLLQIALNAVSINFKINLSV